MEFNEKLQQLRKSKGLTQEELAQALYVSRAAVSKWELGRGYPSIDLLKSISVFFDVSVDDLISGDKLISVAENENKKKLKKVYKTLLGIADTFSLLFILLPIYPNKTEDFVYSVCFFDYTQASEIIRAICFMLYISLFALGIAQTISAKKSAEKCSKILLQLSTVINILTVTFLALTHAVYAAVLAILLLAVKGLLIIKHMRT